VLAVLACGPALFAQHLIVRGSTQQRVARFAGDKLVLTGMTLQPTTVQKEVQVPAPGGHMVRKTVTEEKWVGTASITSHDAAELRAYTPDRKRLEPADLAKRLAAGAVVFVCEAHEKADTAYVALLKPDTVCLFPPYQDAAPTPSAPAGSAGEKSLPARPQPEAAVAVIDSAGKLTLRRRIINTFEKTAYPTIENPREQAPVLIKNTMTTDHVQELPAASVRAFDLAGKPVSAADLAAVLSAERPVLVSHDGQPVDPAFLQIIRPDTLILALPSDQPTAARPPAPPAAASQGTR
jgi:hypothetical protein